ncbi:MAG TPA: GntR family transcriptional regulator [Candidatus Lumbricidophila sp.]|nr:GntR family transcriptional regulator [Candidatus Lumbricidophila sp.]
MVGARRTTAGPVLSPIELSKNGERASDLAYTQLFDAIRDLRLPPGTTLSEPDLAEQLEVSRTPIREAVSRLVNNGLVSVKPKVGTVVDPIPMWAVTEAQFVRELLEVGAFKVVAGSHDRDVSEMRRLIDEQRECQHDANIAGFFHADELMHEQLFVLSGNTSVWGSLRAMKVQLDRVRRLSLPDPARITSLIAEHEHIVDALEAGDIERGEYWLKLHIGRVRHDAPALRTAHPELFTD